MMGKQNPNIDMGTSGFSFSCRLPTQLSQGLKANQVASILIDMFIYFFSRMQLRNICAHLTNRFAPNTLRRTALDNTFLMTLLLKNSDRH
ncbi:hypothetical protein CEXT_656681 [Caerostris extrusa]|uniref:Uncharacterized protein n=1 Tax=Caerostris extrusa TaxID=172846 RepID=A0AAV4XE26_CAEEX|nr:hypothetical protein CEXT_656681 [Caerostris extrusa]